MASRSKSKIGKSPSPTHSSSTTGHQSRRSAKSRESIKQKDGAVDSMAFKILSSADTKTLAAVEDVDELQMKTADLLKITHFETNLKDGAVLDYYVAGLWWGKEQGYSAEQLSAFFTVIHNVLENVQEKHMTVSDNLKELRKSLAGIGQENPEINGGLATIFDISQAKQIADYLYTSLFQHYRLFTFMFEHAQAEEIIGTDLDIEVPEAADVPWPPPLDEGISAEIYDKYIATPPPTPAPEADTEAQEGTEAGEGGDVTESEGQGPEGDKVKDGEDEKSADLLAQLTPEQIRSIMDSVFEEVLGGLKADVAGKLREKENAFINRINKIHNVDQR